MSTEATAKPQIKLLKLNKALKLAEEWVSKMSGSADDEPVEKVSESRPSRLGLGAKVIRQTEVTDSADPVQRKLVKKLGIGKKTLNSKTLNSNPSNVDEPSDDEDESESRCSAFTKKRTIPLPSFQAQKKGK